MTEAMHRPIGYWQHLERVIAAKVEAALRADEAARKALAAYLRGIEEAARIECDRHETIQVIASGRRLLGDATNVGSADEPFVRFV